MTDRSAYYFGCWGGRLGHYLHNAERRTIYDLPQGFPWKLHHLDTGLLNNGTIRDIYDGRVFWTCGGRDALWYAFFWWDNSVDRRGASNSGFCVKGFKIGEADPAFRFACETFPDIVSRQSQPLVLQNPDAILAKEADK